MRVSLNIPAEHQNAFYTFLKQHPGVRVESPDYTLPGPPMTQEELEAVLDAAWQEALDGKAVSLDEFKAMAAKW